MMSSSRPRCARSPSTGRPILPASSDTKKIASPGLAPVAAVSSAALVVGQKLRDRPFGLLGQHEVRDAGETQRLARPRPSCRRSCAISRPLRARQWRARPCPSATAFANTAKPDSRKISVTSTARIGLRRSGLSLPYGDHRLVVRNARKRRRRHLPVGELREQPGQHRLDRREHIVLLDERHLEVELVELARRSIGARILVAEARRDLEVAIEARHHQQLLELLRRLRQRVELARVNAARHQIVARAFRRARRQDRRLILEESLIDHPPADARDDLRSQHDVARGSSRAADRGSGTAAAALPESPACRPPETAAVSAADSTSSRSATTSMRPVGSVGLMFSSVRAMHLARHGDHALELHGLGGLERVRVGREHAPA